MTPEEAASFLRAARADLPHVWLYCALAFGTGARPAALLELTREQCDFEGGVIHLNPKGRRQNKKHRPSIPMASFLVPLLRPLPPGALIRFNGRPLKSIRMPIERVRERAAAMGGPAMLEVSAYTLRHTVATELRGRSVQPWELAGFLGHSTGYRTTEMYAKNRRSTLEG